MRNAPELASPGASIHGREPSTAATNDFCTLFDCRYLPRGLALYRSLLESGASFHLRVLCMDEITKELLDDLRLPTLTTISLDELEAYDPELARVRDSRTRVEYCWTATAPLCLLCLEREPLAGIAYLDADVLFYGDPAPALAELDRSSVLLTPHRFSRRWRYMQASSGVYNVQLVRFRGDRDGLRTLRWWREQCLTWCHDRVDHGRYGDQRYLDDWPQRFERVGVLEHPSAGLGPWSSGRFRLELVDGRVHVDGRPLLFYHFHGFRFTRPDRVTRVADRLAGGRALPGGGSWASDFPLTAFERRVLWAPYALRVAEETERVLALAPELRSLLESTGEPALGRRLALRLPRPLPAMLARARRLSLGREPTVHGA